MESFFKTKCKQKVKKKIKEEEVLDVTDNNDYCNFNILDLGVIILSCFSVISDICTDLILVVQYSYQGHRAWALGTFVLIFFPSLIVQFFSMKWHIYDKSVNFVLWVLHGCMLGILYRYFIIIKFAIKAFKSKNSSDIEKVYLDQSDLCMLHLFESFLESAPQLVLQTYVIIALHEWRFWTVLSAMVSLSSLAWALVAYSKSQRQARPNKNKTKWPGLVLQAIWRGGMLTARITTLVLAACSLGNYVFVVIFLHWIAMTAWIVYQKTDFCETFWEERIYNAVVGVIYIFCFFNLLEGQSRWRLLSFYLIIAFQNLSCLKIFLMLFGKSNPKLAVFSFIAIVGGMIVGTISMMLYYKFFHPSAPITFFSSREDHPNEEELPAHSTLTLRSLKRMHCESPENQSPKHCNQRKSAKCLNNQSPLSDSIIIVEESSFETDTDTDIRTLRNWIKEENDNDKMTNDSANINLLGQLPPYNCKIDNDAYKRRAICSSVDLEKLLESKTVEMDSSKTDEAPSEILSAHDYENLCAVNIARETWGLRSWKAYTDIETCLHDDSENNDRKLETLTSTTTSSDTLLKDEESLNQDDDAEKLMLSETEIISDDVMSHFSIDTFPIYPLGALPPIIEVEETNVSAEPTPDIKIREGSASTLVATIDEIRRNTPIQNRYRTAERIYDVSPVGSLKLNPVQKWSRVRRAPRFLLLPQTNVKLPKEIDSGLAEPTVQKENDVDLEKSMGSSNEITVRDKQENAKEISNIKNIDNDCSNKENIPTVASKISHWNKILNSEGTNKSFDKPKISPGKIVNVREKRNLFLKKVLSSSNFPTLPKKKANS